LLDGKPITSCMILAADCEGMSVTTVEGVTPAGGFHPVQKALVEKGGIQCGFCTPGMVMAAIGLLNDNPHPTAFDVREGLAGNLCRCTGYKKIVEAVLSVEEPQS
ncbi:MAG TPA: 2Fe-2S iron-sulfur cluster-binding protein, partial [Anaerolineales bacterium]|nr:2Fe-2S iron-sulfur cluster-binding protein [Anaerolineales bacterium]